MSIPLQGRGLSFPIAWNRTEAQVDVPEVTEVRDLSDDELMSGLQSKNSGALSLLLDRYSRLVLSVALHILHDYGEAEEIVQEVFFHVFQKANLFNPSRGTAKAWILQIAFHRTLDRKSYLERRGFYFSKDIAGFDSSLFGKTDVEHEIVTRLNRVHLEKAFEGLPAMQRRTLELFYFDGLPLREISEKLHEPLGNIRHHYYRGLERLRENAFLRRLWRSDSCRRGR